MSTDLPPNTIANASAVITVPDPLPDGIPEVPDHIVQKFAAPKIQVLAQLPKTHKTVWLAGFSPLLSPNVRSTRCPKGIMLALGTLDVEVIARVVPVLIFDTPICLHFTKYGSCSRPGCVCTHRDELQLKRLIAVRYMQMKNFTKAQIKEMIRQTLVAEGLTDAPIHLPSNFSYHKDAGNEDQDDEDLVGDGGYTQTGQRRMQTEIEGDELLNDDQDENVVFEDESDRVRFLQQLEQERIQRRKRLLTAARKNALSLPPLPVLPPDVNVWWNEQKQMTQQIGNRQIEINRLPIELRELGTQCTTIGRAPALMVQQAKLEPWRLFPPVPQITYGGKQSAVAEQGTVTEDYLKTQAGLKPQVDLISVLNQQALGAQFGQQIQEQRQKTEEEKLMAAFETPLIPDAPTQSTGYMNIQSQQQQFGNPYRGGRGVGGGFRGGFRGSGGRGGGYHHYQNHQQQQQPMMSDPYQMNFQQPPQSSTVADLQQQYMPPPPSSLNNNDAGNFGML